MFLYNTHSVSYTNRYKPVYFDIINYLIRIIIPIKIRISIIRISHKVLSFFIYELWYLWYNK